MVISTNNSSPHPMRSRSSVDRESVPTETTERPALSPRVNADTENVRREIDRLMSPREQREALPTLAAGELLGDSLLSVGRRERNAVDCYAAANARTKVLDIGKKELEIGKNPARQGFLYSAARTLRIARASRELLEVGDQARKQELTALAAKSYSDAVDAGAELSDDQREFLKTAAWDCFEGRAKAVRESGSGKSQILRSDVPVACAAFRVLKTQLTAEDEAKLLDAAESWWAEDRRANACYVYRLLGRALSAERNEQLRWDVLGYKNGSRDPGRLESARVFLEVLRDDEGLIELANIHLDRFLTLHIAHEDNRIGLGAEAIRSARELYEETGRSLPPDEIVERTAALIKAGHLDTAMLLSILAPVRSSGGIGASEFGSTGGEAGRTPSVSDRG